MLAIQGKRQRLCDGLARRDFLRVGALGGLGLTLPTLLRAAASQETGPARFGQARRCILLFLTGGPPQLDTWDLKPDAPLEYRGELRPIATNVPGIHISELLPRLARQADQYCIVRSVTHGDNIHTSAGYTMLTGVVHPQANGKSADDIRPGANDHPHIGSLLARVRPARDGLPVFVALPEIIKDAGVNIYPGLDGGFLGKQFAPFRIEAQTSRTSFQIPDVALPPDMTIGRLDERRAPARPARRMALGRDVAMDGWYQKAFALLKSAKVREAFDLSGEPSRRREAYGAHLFGQGCLLARRLIEAGVAPGHRLLALRRAGRFAGLGHASEQLQAPARAAAAADRRGRRRAAGRPGRARPARRDAGDLPGRVRPHAADQQARAAATTGPPCNRWCWRAAAFARAASTAAPIRAALCPPISRSAPPT